MMSEQLMGSSQAVRLNHRRKPARARQLGEAGVEYDPSPRRGLEARRAVLSAKAPEAA